MLFDFVMKQRGDSTTSRGWMLASIASLPPSTIFYFLEWGTK